MYGFGVSRWVEIEEDKVYKRAYNIILNRSESEEEAEEYDEGEYGLDIGSEAESEYYLKCDYSPEDLSPDGEIYNAREIELYKEYGDKFDCLAAIDAKSTNDCLIMEKVDAVIGDILDEYWAETDFSFIQSFINNRYYSMIPNRSLLYKLEAALEAILIVKRYKLPYKVSLHMLDKFAKQLKELDELCYISEDLHSHNYGFKNGKIMIFDYAGYESV